VIVSTGIYYGVALTAAGLVTGWLAGPWLGVPLYLAAAFCLWFFRDPERQIPAGPIAVSPADGKVLVVKPEGPGRNRLTIFLNVFDVHVNRTPVAGVVRTVEYKRGLFLVASQERCSEENEQNVVTIETPEGCTVVFKQIAGLIARRVVFNPKPGDTLHMGERIGMMKFGSRMDVIFGPEWDIVVRAGQRVVAGETVIARRREGEAHGS
jgi:phosphatidylserine decarboxylase